MHSVDRWNHLLLAMTRQNKKEVIMRSMAKFVALACLLAVSGCSSLSWLNPFSSSDKKNQPTPLQEFKATLAARTLWSADVGKSDIYVFTPAVLDKHVYVAAANGTLMKLDLVSGRPVWRIDADTSLTAGVGANGNTIAVAGKKGSLIAFDADGKRRWKIQASSEILTAPAVGFGLVVVRSIDNRVAAYDIETGVRKWAVDRPLPPLTLRSVAGIVLTEQAAIVATPGGKLVALAMSTGNLRWEAAVADPKGATELERVADVSGTPVLVDNEVCTVAYQGRVGCYDIASGTARWAKPFSSEVGVGADQLFLFAVDTTGGVSGFSRNAGSSAWRNDKLLNRRVSTPVSFGRAVVVGDGFGFMHFLSREDGVFLARLPLDGGQISATPVVAGSSLIVQTKTGAVVAIATE